MKVHVFVGLINNGWSLDFIEVSAASVPEPSSMLLAGGLRSQRRQRLADAHQIGSPTRRPGSERFPNALASRQGAHPRVGLAREDQPSNKAAPSSSH